MALFINQEEILQSLLEGAELIVDGELIIKLIDGFLKIRKITEDNWREPVFLYNYLHRYEDWSYYSAERNQELLNAYCVKRWCWVSDDDPSERTTIVKVKKYFSPDKFIDSDNLWWKYATPTTRWERSKWGYYSPFESE
jgi:hypothetical protein